MAGVVVVYYSKFGAPLYAHEKATLVDVAGMIARLKDCEIAGSYDAAFNYAGKIFFVPDDTEWRKRPRLLIFALLMISLAALSLIPL